jgi:hypothetical protein
MAVRPKLIQVAGDNEVNQAEEVVPILSHRVAIERLT